MPSLDIRGKQIPLTLLAAILVVAGAGAAAGVTMQGDVTGDATTKVDQSLVVNDVQTSGSANNALGTVSDDNTAFKHSANINQGDEYTINLNVTNRGSQNVTGRLVLDVPEPLEVEVDGNQFNSDVARTSMYKWQFRIGPGDNNAGDISITVATPDDVEPGFYTIEGQIKPTET